MIRPVHAGSAVKTKVLIACCCLLLFGALAAPVMGFWIFQRLERSLKVPVNGRFEPRFFQTSFVIRDAALTWDNKVSLQSGDVTVHYDLGSLVSGKGIRVKLNGQKLPVTLLGELAQIGSKPKITVDDFFADLLFDKDGLKEMSALRVKLPELQYQIGRSA